MGFVFISLIVGCICGAITFSMNESKGYDTNGFWWGFWLGIIGIIVVACKPEYYEYTPPAQQYNNPYAPPYNAPYNQPYNNPYSNPNLAYRPAPNTWQCSCGRVNPNYQTSCTCGLSKYQNLKSLDKPAEAPKAEKKSQQPALEVDTVSALKQYKELLDAGVLSQEEFDAKKKQLLNL